MNECLHGDVRDILPTLPDESVQMCVTSPPYWGLRDYGTGTWEGGRDDCDHRIMSYPPGRETPGGRKGSMPASETVQRETCAKCGARRIDAQIGLEATPEAYVATMVEVFREVRRVLRKDGTLWLNLGDSYWNGGAEKRDGGHGFVDGGKTKLDAAKGSLLQKKSSTNLGLKPKDLCGIPWRVALALQADGWYLRQDIIWHKPNPMPESVTDRCTSAHEYLFLLSREGRYYYDAEAVAEKSLRAGDIPQGVSRGIGEMGVKPGWGSGAVPDNRNRRSVWTIPSAPYADAHFATFPPALVEPCILAGSRPGDVVLDPFMGSGTVAEVAQRLERRWLGVELNPDYHTMQARRTAQGALPLEVDP